jgi:hypothetical protein
MTAAARIARRLVRKIIKPAALLWTRHQLAQAEERAEHFMNMRSQIVPMELYERKRAVKLTARRNQIQNW